MPVLKTVFPRAKKTDKTFLIGTADKLYLADILFCLRSE